MCVVKLRFHLKSDRTYVVMVSNYILVLVSKIRFVQSHAAFPDSPHQRFLQVEVAFSALADLEENPPMPRLHRTLFPKVETGIATSTGNVLSLVGGN